MENVYENVRRELTPENVKEALQVMLERINLPENEAKIITAKEQAGDDMVEVMRLVFPIVVSVQVEVLGKFGFTGNQEGLKEFLIRVNQLSNTNLEILDLLVKIRETYLPGFNNKQDKQQSIVQPRKSSNGSNIGIQKKHQNSQEEVLLDEKKDDNAENDKSENSKSGSLKDNRESTGVTEPSGEAVEVIEGDNEGCVD